MKPHWNTGWGRDWADTSDVKKLIYLSKGQKPSLSEVLQRNPVSLAPLKAASTGGMLLAG
ncbi:MAG: hypothetical protein Fur0025_08180 [Oscillatoriaceae cyanobacterium]